MGAGDAGSIPGRISCGVGQLGLCTTTIEHVLWSLGATTAEAHVPWSLCSATEEATAMRGPLRHKSEKVKVLVTQL